MAVVRCVSCCRMFLSAGAYLHPAHRCSQNADPVVVDEPDSGMVTAGVVVPLFRKFGVVDVCEEQFSDGDSAGRQESVGFDARFEC